jgi:hypothetical protein
MAKTHLVKKKEKKERKSYVKKRWIKELYLSEGAVQE